MSNSNETTAIEVDLEAGLSREPFEPFRIHLKDGRKFDVDHKNVAHLLSQNVLILLGLRKGTHQANGYDVFPYEYVDRLEPRPQKRGATRRRKAS